MTDRFHSLTVVLEKDMREDDAEVLITAIRLLRGVLSVEGNISDGMVHVAHDRARFELGQKLLDVLYPERKKTKGGG